MILFKYKSGSNPYIAKTENEAKKIINKYKNKNVEITKQRITTMDVYTIHDTKKEDIRK